MKTLRIRFSLTKKLPDLAKAPRCICCGSVTNSFLCSTCDVIVQGTHKKLSVECCQCGKTITRNRSRGFYFCFSCQRERRSQYFREYWKRYVKTPAYAVLKEKTPERRRRYYFDNREKLLNYNKERYYRLKKEREQTSERPYSNSDPVLRKKRI